MDNDYLKSLIDAHWEYVSGILCNARISPDEIKAIEYHYRTAFQHGWKHAMEYMAEKRLDQQDEE